MNITDATIVLAGVTFILAIASFMSIIEVRLSQKREIRMQFLSNIVEWTTDVLNIGRSFEVGKRGFEVLSWTLFEGRFVDELSLREQIS